MSQTEKIFGATRQNVPVSGTTSTEPSMFVVTQTIQPSPDLLSSLRESVEILFNKYVEDNIPSIELRITQRFERRIRALENEIRALQSSIGARKYTWESIPHNEGDDIYEGFRLQLEKDHMNEVVAIDTESRKIVGYGHTLRQAYDAARKNSNKKQFYFKRVGKPYVERL